MNPYNYQLALAQARERVADMSAAARSRLGEYRGRVESGIGQTKTMAEIVGAAAGASYLSARFGGPTGKNVLGLPIEAWIGGGAAVLALSGSAGRHSEDVMAIGVGALAGLGARYGFEQGLKHASPQVLAQAAQQSQQKVAGYVGDPGWVGATPIQAAEAVLDRLAH